MRFIRWLLGYPDPNYFKGKPEVFWLYSFMEWERYESKYAPGRRLRDGRYHLYCPKCKFKMTPMMPRQYRLCPKCSLAMYRRGSDWDSELYVGKVNIE